MLTAIFGLTGALLFGAADFLGGLGSKRISALRVTAVAGATGFVVLLVALPVVGGAWSTEAVLLGALSGITGAAAIALLYACLAIGPMSILSPLTAVVSAIVPMTWGLLQGEALRPVGYWALALALVAVVLVGFVPERGAVRPTPRGLGMAVASGTLIGAFLIIIDATPDDSGLVPLVVNRLVNSVSMFAAVAVLAVVALRRSRARAALGARTSATEGESLAVRDLRSGGGRWLPGLKFALACGVVDAIANALLLVGLRLGELTVMSVLTAMYPAGTILLAAIVLRERITPVQIIGLVLALAAAGMLALA
ncbi:MULTISPECIES: EamA family transporter [unclassified Diaminobutyricimonas]|uniref:EamA family transporter n=1 Tax=unclassified Diaminobutyricimonas TaxID=2643261 RepID=UPI0012F4FA14|nr:MULTISPECIES: EamA family transporter [unclassified Diaminobutyricimonas]